MNVNILNAEVGLDHVHMLIGIPPNMSVSTFMGWISKEKEESNDILEE